MHPTGRWAEAPFPDRLEATQAELHAVTRRWELAKESAGIGVWEYDPQAGTLIWDDQMYALYGVDPKTFSGAYETWEQGVHPDDRERAAAEVARAVAESGEFHSRFRVVHPDGSIRHIEAHARILEGIGGEGAKMIGVNWDVTREWTAVTELEGLNAHLEARVQERTADLVAANRELEDFAYTVAHDLRAPLRQIHSFARILQDDHAEDLPGSAFRLLARVQDGAVRMGRLVDDLLEYSRLGKQHLRVAVVEPEVLVLDILRDLVGDGKTNPVVLGDLPPCHADPELLRRVFLNLLDNALKFASADHPRVHVGAVEVEGRTVYFVRDNGIGFDMRYADEIFGVFKRLHRQEEYPGTGVGLATVKRIVDRHGGRVWVTSAPGAGTTFYLQLDGDPAR